MHPRRITLVLLLALLLTLTSSILPIYLPDRGLIPERKARDPRNDPTLPTWELWFGRAIGRDTIAYWRMQMSGLNVSIPVADFERDKINLSDLPRHLRPKALADLDIFAVFTTTGWPLRAFACSAEDVSQSGKRRGNEHWRVDGGLLLQTRGNFPPRILPLRPIWTGLLFNTLFYAVTLLATLAGIRAARRAFRARRGSCPACGYSRDGLTPTAACPECGQAVQPHERVRVGESP